MKKFILSAGFLFLFIPFLSAQSPDYKVVFDLTSKDTSTQRTLLPWLNGISKGTPGAQLEVVLYGQSLGMITKGKSLAEEEIKKLMANKNITFRVCGATMKRSNVTLDDLIPGVESVPDGIYQIITRQGQGWGYIKVGQ